MSDRYMGDLKQFIIDVESKRGDKDKMYSNETKHINFYHSHTKKELLDYIINYTKTHDLKNDYDFMYMMRSIIKYMGNNLDMGTSIDFPTFNALPFRVKFVDGGLYIDGKNSQYNKGKLLEINGVSVNKIIEEIEGCVTYGTVGGYETKVEKFFLSIDNILSLPSIDSKSDKITFKTNAGSFDIENRPYEQEHIEYEKYSIDGHTLIFKCPYCKEECAPDIQKIEGLVNLYKIENFVLDLRGNNGGNNSVILPLIKYLKANSFNLTTIVDKGVSSSGQLAMMEMKRMGSNIIGEDIGTQTNYFGGCYSNGTLGNTHFKYSLSKALLYYDENSFRMRGIFTREELNKHKDEVLKLRYLKLDKEIIYTANDFICDRDPVKEYIENNKSVLIKR